ncbi:hypothetical protein Hypma_000160 [Hypsizygus marmoreus]|uniref:Uncharacterized protein n=1 Tax=Hypsizygus marmoreus TaxID=39966 RepID=A0A369KH28_HYPMA|nr:hypothetical protein Hypma_000160 [Hypsizygus marmoreus]
MGFALMLKKQTAKAEDLLCRLHNKNREADWAKASCDALQEGKKHLKHVLHMKSGCVPLQKKLAVGQRLSVKVQDSIHARTAGRIMNEGFTISSDGTTIKHLNFESGHVSMNSVPNYTGSSTTTSATPTMQFFGITSGLDYTTAWLKREMRQCLYNQISIALRDPVDLLTFMLYLYDLGFDHSEDQKKLNRLI